jgi:PAS domain S-box-containing protein
MTAPSLPEPAPGASWRQELITRFGWLLFGAAGAGALWGALFFGPEYLFTTPILLLPATGAFAAIFGARLGLRRQAQLLIGTSLFAGGMAALSSGPSPATLFFLLLAPLLASVVFGSRGGVLAMIAAATLLLTLGSAGRMSGAAEWAAGLSLASTWYRITGVFALMAGIVVLLVATAVRQAEASLASEKQAVARAETNERLLRAIVEDQTEMIVRWKPDGTRTFVNGAYCKVFGITPEQAIGTSFLPLVAEHEVEGVLSKIRSLTPESPVSTEPHESVTASGAPLWQEWTDRGLFDASGRLVELQSTGRDITENRLSQLALQDSEERYRLLFEGNPLPMLVFEPDTLRFLAVNAAAVEQYGYTREELLELSFDDLAVPGAPRWSALVSGLGSPRPSIVHLGPRQQRRRDGSVVDVDLTALQVPFAGRLVRLTVARDVTRLVVLQASLQRAEVMAALGSIVAGVAHEVRGPLFSISATIDVLEAELRTHAAYAEFAPLLRSQVTRLSQLTRDLLDYGKAPTLNLMDTDVSQLVQTAVRHCALTARTHSVKIVEDVPGHLPRLYLDTEKLLQVIENLVTNAIQYSPSGAEVRVSARAEGRGADGEVLLLVEDRGPGVPLADAARVFEPFFSRRKGGTGLGLSIVQRIVEAHGGKVSVEPGEGGGLFTVRLPLVPPRAD